MALSDELLLAPGRLEAVRDKLRDLLSELDANAAFLVDEAGNPFATVGHVEFRLPHPVAPLSDVLSALLGEKTSGETPFYLVERVSERALVVLVQPTSAGRARERLQEAAKELAPLLI